MLPPYAVLLAACALGGGPGEGRDAGAPPDEERDAGCEGAGCVPPPDDDGDGVPVSQDCDDSDPEIGRMAAIACSSDCGDGFQSCTDGVWSPCDAPTTCDCVEPRECDPGEVDMGATCGDCGREERRCRTDCTWGPVACVDQGECAAGSMDTPETRDCPGTCGGTQTRTRTCSASCQWEPFGDWSPDCPTCGGGCGDGTCDAGETCASCADCRAGHLGSGSGGDPCSSAAEGQWRCVTQMSLGRTVSQVCRGGTWINFNTDPRNCSACVCGFSTDCCQPGSPSTGC